MICPLKLAFTEKLGIKSKREFENKRSKGFELELFNSSIAFGGKFVL